MSEVAATTTTTEKKPPVVYPAKPKCIGDINLEYIYTYIEEEAKNGNLTREQLVKLANAKREISADKGTHYFIKFRQTFCEVCFPKLVSSNGKKFDLDALFNNLLAD